MGLAERLNIKNVMIKVKNRELFYTAVFASFHLVITLVSILISTILTMNRFDTPEKYENTFFQEIVSVLADLLTFPVSFLHSSFWIVDWLLIIGNSIIWGIIITGGYLLIKRKKAH